MDEVRFDFYWSAAATSGFMISGSGNPFVDPHEVGIVSEFGDEFDCSVPLS
jgi:hypothetical protein